ncbi:protein GAMETE CELL DEFECTIVE 1, mitochondrial [Diospyros lotus]|uniref:protein GAMETE CELL DEFECTIVE 1, mitochondrial n=1 Tax=Diospyros lotus TaxID=55363 RepID=UPI00224E5F65|nr:protein GAMETE CELL DEFECTIVE 1, mitochondrial [Diospyros lotus]
MNSTMRRFSSVIGRPLFDRTITQLRPLSTKSTGGRTAKNGDDEWNEAWESAWLPEDVSGKSRAPWETDVNFSLSQNASTAAPFVLPSDADAEAKAFVEDMTDNWDQRRNSSKSQQQKQQAQMEKKDGTSLYSLENLKKDYRLKKQRVHAGLWVKEIEKLEEAKLRDPIGGANDIERLLDSCSEIFDSPTDLNNLKIPSSSELKNKPDGWETTSNAQDGSVWEMSQREEDILLQEFERRIAFCKFQIASFIKTHIFSRRRPIDGWKYMIEEIGPNAKRGKGSVTRLPSLADESTQPFREEKAPTRSSGTSYTGR